MKYNDVRVKVIFKLLVIFSVSVGCVVVSLPDSALAGYRCCQSYPDDTSTCFNEAGFLYKCKRYEGGNRSVCIGKNNYRRECFNVEDTGTCLDSNGVKTVCKHSGASAVCENSKGFRATCQRYDGNVSICTDVSRWGKPIKE
jgi:hypothetical protein